MKKRAALFLIASLVICVPALAQTADDIVARYVAARGGIEKLRAIHTMTLTGKLIGPGMDAPIVVVLKQPNKFHMDMTVQDKTITQVFDGNITWQIQSLGGKTGAELLTGGESINIQDQADITGVLVDYKAKGHQVELVGKETIGGVECYKLKATLKTGTVMVQYLDAGTYLEVREELIRTTDGKQTTIEETVGNYESTGGVLFPRLYDSNTKGSADHYRLVIDKIELNLPVDDRLFRMPAN